MSKLSFSNRRYYLLPAEELNLIKMTIQDNPSSMNQRYVRV